MLSALVALSLTPIAYSLTPGSSNTYYLRVGLDGFLPLLGGKEGQAQVDMTLKVDGQAPDPKGDGKASMDLTAFDLKINGAPLGVNLDEAKAYFPKSTATFTPQGHVDANDAPDIPLPVRIPGLDPKRFPDITYLPVEFPVTGVDEGKSFTFKRPFAGVDLVYTVTPIKVDDNSVEMKIDLSSHDQYLVDAANGITTDEKQAASKIVADTTGGGTATFDRKHNLMEKVSVKMTTSSQETDLSTKKTTPHQLVETLDVSLNKALPASALSLSHRGSSALDLLRNKVQQSGAVQGALVVSQFMHPSSGSWRSALPLVRSAVNRVYVPSQNAVRGQVQNLTVLASHAVARVPELFNVQSVQRVGSFLSSVPSVIGSHWSPYNERASGLADQLVQYISPDDASAYKAAGVRWRKNQHKTSLPARQIKASR